MLNAEQRSERGSRPAGRLRRAGRVPGVVYGLGGDAVPVTVPARELGHILSGGANTLISLHLGKERQLTLARQVQRHPTRGDLVHVDLVRVRADVAVTAEVALHLTGEPEGVRDGGLLEQLVFAVHIEAKPKDIPAGLELDAGPLGVGDQLRLSDVSLPPGVTTTMALDTLVAQVVMPRVHVEAEVPSEGVEGEAAAEGEPAEAGGASEAEAAEE